MKAFPKDGESRSVGSRARAIVHYRFNLDHWEYREPTGVDVGVDCMLELTEDDQWTANTISCQVKGRSAPKFNSNREYISIPTKVSTVNYGLSIPNSFLLLLVDVKTEDVYYLSLKEYFIDNPKLFDKLSGSQEEITLRIPIENIVLDNDVELQNIAKYRYLFNPDNRLHRII